MPPKSSQPSLKFAKLARRLQRAGERLFPIKEETLAEVRFLARLNWRRRNEDRINAERRLKERLKEKSARKKNLPEVGMKATPGQLGFPKLPKGKSIKPGEMAKKTIRRPLKPR